RRGGHQPPAAAAVAPFAAPAAAESSIVADSGIENGRRAARDIQAASEASAAVGTAFAVAAVSPVVRELAAQDGEQTTAPDPAAPTEASTAANGTCGTPAGLVVGERTVQHRQPCRAAEV